MDGSIIITLHVYMYVIFLFCMQVATGLTPLLSCFFYFRVETENAY